MRQMRFYKSDQRIIKSIENKENEYIEYLKKDCNQGEDAAKTEYKIYQGFANTNSSDFEDLES